MLAGYREYVDWITRPVAEFSDRIGLTPNTLTVLSFLTAVLAGYTLWLGQMGRSRLLILGGILVLVSSLLDAVDGKLARLQGVESSRGDFLEHTADRYADLAIILGIGLGPTAGPLVTLFAVTGTLLTSYMGTQAQAVGAGRDYGGLLGRADRLVLLSVIPIIQGLYPGYTLLGANLLFLLLAFIAVFGNLTALERFLRGWNSLTD